MRRLVWLGVSLALLIAAVGCKENRKATMACKGKAGNSTVCNSCCSLNGASGSVWSGGCSCVGGR